MVFVERKEADCPCLISDVLEHQATGDVYHTTQYLSDGLKCRVVYLHCPGIHTYIHIHIWMLLLFLVTFTNSLIYQLKKKNKGRVFQVGIFAVLLCFKS